MVFSSPTALPSISLGTTLSPIIGQDCIIDDLSLVNIDSVDRNVTIKDGSGRVYEPLFTVPAGTRQLLALSASQVAQGVFFARGLWMSASVAGVIDVWVSARLKAPQ